MLIQNCSRIRSPEAFTSSVSLHVGCINLPAAREPGSSGKGTLLWIPAFAGMTAPFAFVDARQKACARAGQKAGPLCRA